MTDTNTGRFVWYDLLTTDPAAATAFYSEVIGWKTQLWENNYTMWVGSQGPLGGVVKLPEQAQQMGAPPHWMAHVRVTDVDKAAARARELGGRVLVEPTDIPKIGRYAVIGDPQGASLAIFKPNEDMALHDSDKHGEFCWHELITSDQSAAFAFYSDVLGWERLHDHDMGAMGIYLIYGRDKTQLGGIFNMPIPPTFFYYVQVDDLDAALDRAKKLGAKVINGPMPVPGGARIVQLTDPQGAAFALHQKAAG